MQGGREGEAIVARVEIVVVIKELGSHYRS